MKLNYIIFNNSVLKVKKEIKIIIRPDKINEIKQYIETNNKNQNILYLDLYLNSININEYDNNNYKILYFNNYGILRDRLSYKFNNFLIIDLINLNNSMFYNIDKEKLYNISKIFYHNIINNVIEKNF